MSIGVTGFNYNTASLEFRESLSFGAHEIGSSLNRLLEIEDLTEGVLLSTCNRTEVYYRSTGELPKEEVLSWFSREKSKDREELLEHAYNYSEIEVANHLFEVITGLDSMVLGEVEIAGQVKEAYQKSRKADSVGKYLNHLFQKSFEVNKEVRSEIDLDGLPVSLSHVAVDQVEEKLGELVNKKAMIIGVGEIGELALKYLIEHGIEKVWVANRTRDRSEKVTRNIGGEPVTFEKREKYVPRVDVLVSATGYPSTLVEVEDVKADREHPLYIVDLAVPRDVNPAVAELENCHLFDVDGLQDLVERNKSERKEAADSVMPVISRHLEEFKSWLDVQQVSEVISSLKKKAEMIKEREIQKLSKDKLERGDMEDVSGRIINTLLHEPIVGLKKAAKGDADHEKMAEVIEGLFDL